MSKEYHRLHPTISFRCRNLDEYNKIKKMVQNSGKSESTFIREILLGSEKQESQSFNSGTNQSFNKFAIPCSICGKPMIFDLNNDTNAANKIYEIFGKYAHTTCLENQKKQQEAEKEALFRKIYFGY